MQFWAILVEGFRESVDRKIFWVLVILTLVIVLLMLSIGFDGENMSFCFGLWKTTTNAPGPFYDFGRLQLVSAVVYIFLAAILGWFGIVLMIIATAGIFPSMMEGGAIDVLLSKPISRARLFLYKYISSMVFVFLQGALFVVLTFLVMGFRWGVWAPGYLLCVLLLVLLFSYVYCMSVWIGVKTRSPVAAILVSIGAWALFAVIHQAPQIFETFPNLKERTALYNTVRIISWIPPKTGDFDYLAARWAGAGISMDIFPSSMMEQADEQGRAQMDRAREVEKHELLKNPVASIGSSLAFEAVIVLLAMWSFVRRDY